MKNKKICVVGLGYIGFPTACLFANNGYLVHGVEKNTLLVESLNEGNIHINEQGLHEMAVKALKSKSLVVSDRQCKADVFIICVPTPIKYESGNEPDLSYVESAISEMAPLLRDGNLIILESTSPVGTIDMIQARLNEKGVDTSSIDIAYCPERVLPGNIMFEMVNNDRIVGGINERSTKVTSELYASICKGSVFETTAKTAELCKLAENSYRDINIAFANELSLICYKEGIDVSYLIELTNKHPRVNILNPGIGVGGHCIPIDPWFIANSYPDYSSLIQTARKVNNHKTNWVLDQIIYHIDSLKLNKPRIACFGLTYKADADDMRESPSLKILDKLLDAGFDVVGVEPHIISHSDYRIFSLDRALDESDLLIFLVKHKKFQDQLLKIKKSNKALLDFCGLL